jgi:hypothetical protein
VLALARVRERSQRSAVWGRVPEAVPLYPRSKRIVVRSESMNRTMAEAATEVEKPWGGWSFASVFRVNG